mgnify:CR=1 FL=1
MFLHFYKFKGELLILHSCWPNCILCYMFTTTADFTMQCFLQTGRLQSRMIKCYDTSAGIKGDIKYIACHNAYVIRDYDMKGLI